MCFLLETANFCALFSASSLCQHKFLITLYWMSLGQPILCHTVCATPAKFDETAFHWFVYLAHYLRKRECIFVVFTARICHSGPIPCLFIYAPVLKKESDSEGMVPWVRNVGLGYDAVFPSYSHISIWLFTTIVKELFLSIFHSGEVCISISCRL